MAYCGTTRYKPAIEWEFAKDGYVPDTAVPGGEDYGETIYIGRATHRGNIIPGKLLPSHRCVYIPWRGGEYAYRNYQVLVNNCGSTLEWKPALEGGIHAGAIQGGITSDGEHLYIGRTWHEETLTVGKVHPSHGVLYISYSGKEISYPYYEILVVKC
ncbi:uncharacterized protein LOC143228938 isoform X2 [Tachypleus tridentatus]|uniref:uncharacterized protein LOC143228938 isoform X2 n=1 Tax=Tachypleus tridentatus TaxID=6853 RepID=UPI003FD22CF1